MEQSTRRGIALLAAMVLAWLFILAGQTGNANESVAADQDPEWDPALASLELLATWQEQSDGSARLVLTPLGRRSLTTARLDLRVMAGPLEHRWTVRLDPVATTAERIVELELPAEVLLDPVVTDYVVDLFVVATVDGVTTAAPKAFVAWPDGPTGAPVVWTQAQMWSSAPAGIVSDSVRSLLPTDLEDAERVLPPIMGVVRPTRAATTRALSDTGLAGVL